MCIVYRIDRKLGVTIHLYDGDISQDELIAHFKRLKSDPDWSFYKRLQLIDLRTATGTKIDPDVVGEAAGFGRTNSRNTIGVRMAIVAHDQFKRCAEYTSSLSKFLSTLIVFNSLDTACLWLGIDLHEAGRILDELRLQVAEKAGV